MMNSTSAFLGTSCFLQFLLCFMSHYHDDHEGIKRYCRSEIGKVMDVLQKATPIMGLEVQTMFSALFMECLQEAGQLSRSLNSSKLLPQQLSQLICIGQHLKSHIRLSISADLEGFSNSVKSLFMLDYQAAKSLLLETRRYYYQQRSQSCEVSYFRLPWLATNDASTKKLFREFAVLCGEHGNINF
jgi:hypothetical protein